MVVRIVAKTRRRGFGGFAIGIASLALLVPVTPAAASAALQGLDSSQIIRLSLTRISSGKEAFEIRGVRPEPGKFSAVANLSRIPCQGEYQYSVQSEIQETGALSAYTALVDLTPFANDQGRPCGGPPPPRPGALHIAMRGDAETIDFSQEGPSGPRDFFGSLTYGTQPVCDQKYTLSMAADLRGWNRKMRYQLKVVRWRAEAQGLPLEDPPDC